MSQCRQLPVEHADDARFDRMEHDIGDAKVAVAQGQHFAHRHTLREPADNTVEVGIVVVAAAKLSPLSGPAVQLAGKIIARASKITEPQRSKVEPMDGSHGSAHGLE